MTLLDVLDFCISCNLLPARTSCLFVVRDFVERSVMLSVASAGKGIYSTKVIALYKPQHNNGRYIVAYFTDIA